jgi:hypothetical protein
MPFGDLFIVAAIALGAILTGIWFGMVVIAPRLRRMADKQDEEPRDGDG